MYLVGVKYLSTLIKKYITGKNDVEHDMEFYDDGFIEGIRTYLNIRFVIDNETDSKGWESYFTKNFIMPANDLIKIHPIGYFSIDHSETIIGIIFTEWHHVGVRPKN
jgi:hypothetical protein